MYSNEEQNLILYYKSKQKVTIHLIIFYIILAAYFVAQLVGFNKITLFDVNSELLNLILTIGIVQLAIYGVVFILLSLGKKLLRYLLIICIVISIGAIYFPVTSLINNLDYIIAYFVYIVTMIINVVILSQMSSYLKNNRWAKIYYDHVIEIEEDEQDWVDKQTRNFKNGNYQKYAKEFNDIDDEKPPLTYQQYAIRLAIVVYSSLMIFPIFTQIFANWFESLDLQKVFATKDMFIICIISALIWTLPVLFLYYSHRHSKKIIVGCIGLEVIRIAWYSTKLYAYYKTDEYSIRVFLIFAAVDMARELILWIYASRILKSDQEFAPKEKDETVTEIE